MTGLETALSVVQDTMIETGLMAWADFARVTSVHSRRRSAASLTRAVRWKLASPPTSSWWTRLRDGPWTP